MCHFWYQRVLLVAMVFLININDVNSLRIGSFNIQIFGESKSKKGDVMDVIGKIVVRYDLILIMEIRDSKKKAIPKLLETVKSHSGGDNYEMIISERLGRTYSKEQYAFLYRNDVGLEVVDSFHYEDGDELKGTDSFEREPFIVYFKSTNTDIKEFVLISVHIDPDEAVAEINALEDVLDYTMGRTGVDNIMIMGDLNAGCRYVSKAKMKTLNIRHRSDLFWLIGDDADTTVRDTHCAYDRFIIKGNDFIDSVIVGSAKVFNYQQEYDLNKQLTLRVSDHYPIEVKIKDKELKIKDKEVKIKDKEVKIKDKEVKIKDKEGGQVINNGRANYSQDIVVVFLVTLVCVKFYLQFRHNV